MSRESDPGPAPPEGADSPGQREVRYEYSRNLAPLLSHLGASLLVSTYQSSPPWRRRTAATSTASPWQTAGRAM
jgi:hypothetical protein